MKEKTLGLITKLPKMSGVGTGSVAGYNKIMNSDDEE